MGQLVCPMRWKYWMQAWHFSLILRQNSETNPSSPRRSVLATLQADHGAFVVDLYCKQVSQCLRSSVLQARAHAQMSLEEASVTATVICTVVFSLLVASSSLLAVTVTTAAWLAWWPLHAVAWSCVREGGIIDACVVSTL